MSVRAVVQMVWYKSRHATTVLEQKEFLYTSSQLIISDFMRLFAAKHILVLRPASP
jgi:hypothetical protein